MVPLPVVQITMNDLANFTTTTMLFGVCVIANAVNAAAVPAGCASPLPAVTNGAPPSAEEPGLSWVYGPGTSAYEEQWLAKHARG
eukprot:COSAG04_NODE_185_length_21024_cov_49.557276_6_plen_85_part_00